MAKRKTTYKTTPKKKDDDAINIPVNNIVPFTYKLVKLMYNLTVDLSQTEKKYGVKFEDFGKIFNGEKFSLLAESLDPKLLGVFIQFIFELNNSKVLDFGKILNSDEKTKDKMKEKMKEILDKYESLFGE